MLAIHSFIPSFIGFLTLPLDCPGNKKDNIAICHENHVHNSVADDTVCTFKRLMPSKNTCWPQQKLPSKLANTSSCEKNQKKKFFEGKKNFKLN